MIENDGVDHLCHYCFKSLPGIPTFFCDGIFAHDICRIDDNYEVGRALPCRLCGEYSECGSLRKCAVEDCAVVFHLPCMRLWLCCNLHAPLKPATPAELLIIDTKRDTSPPVAVPISSLSIASQISDRDPRKRHFLALSPSQELNLDELRYDVLSSTPETASAQSSPEDETKRSIGMISTIDQNSEETLTYKTEHSYTPPPAQKKSICMQHFAFNTSGCRYGSSCKYTHDVKEGIESMSKMEVLLRRKGLTLDREKWFASSGEAYSPVRRECSPTVRKNTKNKNRVKLCLKHFAIKPNKMNFCEAGDKCLFAHDVADTYQSKAEVIELMDKLGWKLNEKRWKKYNSIGKPELPFNANDIVVAPAPPSKSLCPYFFAVHLDCFSTECNLCHDARRGLESKEEFIQMLARQGLKLDEDKWRDSWNK